MITFEKLNWSRWWSHNWHADPKAIGQINFTGNLEIDAKIFFSIKEVKEKVPDFSKWTVKVLWFYCVLI